MSENTEIPLTEAEIEALVSQPLSAEQATGGRPLPAEGLYENVRITGRTIFAPGQFDDPAMLKFTVALKMSPESDPTMTLEPRIKIKHDNLKMNPRHFSLVSAIWPSEKKRTGTTVDDWIGKTVHVTVSHPKMNGKTYAEYEFEFAG